MPSAVILANPLETSPRWDAGAVASHRRPPQTSALLDGPMFRNARLYRFTGPWPESEQAVGEALSAAGFATLPDRSPSKRWASKLRRRNPQMP